MFTQKEMRPVKIYFEVTNYCNFSCDFCPIHASERKKHHMEFSLFQKGIDEIAAENLTDTVGFHILGEPLMYPAIYDAIRYARQKGLRTEINTNGSLLTQERIQGLVEAGLDEMAVSVQVVDEEEHASRGSSIPFTQYYSRVMDAIRLVRQSDSQMDLIFCFMNKSSKKWFDVDRSIRMDWEADPKNGRLLAYILDIGRAAGKELDPEKVRRSISRMNLDFPQVIKIEEHTKVYVHPFADWGNAFTNRKVHPARFGTCGYALKNLGILSNGEIVMCCPDYDGKTSLGNLYRQSLCEILSSEQVKKIRRGFEGLKVVHPHCQRCMGSTNPIKAFFKGLMSIYLFRWADFQPAQVREVQL